MDKNSKKSIMQAKTLSNNTYTDDIIIKEIDFNNDYLNHKLIINNIAVMYINVFWYKHMRKTTHNFGKFVVTKRLLL